MAISIAAAASAAMSGQTPTNTFSSYTPALGDVVILFPMSTVGSGGTGLNIQANASLPSGWVNPLGDGVEVQSDAHGMAILYHIVTAGEVSAVTTTYTATNALANDPANGQCSGVVVRDVDTTSPVITGLAASTFDSNNATPHVLAGLTGARQPDVTGGMVVSCVVKDATGTYTAPGGWTERTSLNTTQGTMTLSRDTLTTSGADVAATNITVSGADEYCSITIALKAASGAATVNRTASMSGTGTLTASGIEVIGRTGSVAGTGTLTASGIEVLNRTATVTGTGTIAGSGTRVVSATGSINGTGTIAGSGTRVAVATGSVSGTGTLSATGIEDISRTATLSGTGTLTSTGLRIVSATGSLSGTGGLTATSNETIGRSASLSGLGTLEADGSIEGGSATIGRTASISGTGTTSASGVRICSRTGTVVGTGLIASSGNKTIGRSASVTGLGNIAATCTKSLSRTASITGTGLLTAIGFRIGTLISTTRVYRVPRVNRTYSIKAEHRVYEIPATTEFDVVESNRTYRIPQEERSVIINK